MGEAAIEGKKGAQKAGFSYWQRRCGGGGVCGVCLQASRVIGYGCLLLAFH